MPQRKVIIVEQSSGDRGYGEYNAMERFEEELSDPGWSDWRVAALTGDARKLIAIMEKP